MSQPILSVLQEEGVVSADQEPMQLSEFNLMGGVPIVDITKNYRGSGAECVIYDNVTSPDGRILMQGPGYAYFGQRVAGELEFEVQKIDDSKPFGAIGIYESDYYLAGRTFVDDLKTKLDHNI